MVSRRSPISRLVWETSSLMPMVKWFLGSGRSNSSNTAFTIAGSNSLLDNPYRPPRIRGISLLLSTKAVTTSKYKGSPVLPGSLVLSRTATFLTVSGRASIKWEIEKGRNKRTMTAPIFSPFFTIVSTDSITGPWPEPIITTIFSAWG